MAAKRMSAAMASTGRAVAESSKVKLSDFLPLRYEPVIHFLINTEILRGKKMNDTLMSCTSQIMINELNFFILKLLVQKFEHR